MGGGGMGLGVEQAEKRRVPGTQHRLHLSSEMPLQ